MPSPMIRIRVKPGSTLRVWIEPTDKTGKRPFTATIRYGTNGTTDIWNNDVLTKSDKNNPLETILSKNADSDGVVRVKFAGPKIPAIIYTQIVTNAGKKNEKQHGDIQFRKVSSTSKNSVKQVDLLTYMKK